MVQYCDFAVCLRLGLFDHWQLRTAALLPPVCHDPLSSFRRYTQAFMKVSVVVVVIGLGRTSESRRGSLGNLVSILPISFMVAKLITHSRVISSVPDITRSILLCVDKLFIFGARSKHKLQV